MKAHLSYLIYVLRHKWFVFLAGIKLNVPLWQLLIHDLSKFGVTEWRPYVYTFYAADGSKQYRPSPAFDAAWNHHQKVNPHHWQYWLLITDSDDPRLRPLPMPDRYVREMVADWQGAGRALGKPDTVHWYLDNCEKMLLHSDTRRRVEQLLRIPYTHLVEQEQRT